MSSTSVGRNIETLALKEEYVSGRTNTEERPPTATLRQRYENKTKAEEAGTASNDDWQLFEPIAVGHWHATHRFCSFNSQVAHSLHLTVPSQ